jgi:hypothetical protein
LGRRAVSIDTQAYLYAAAIDGEGLEQFVPELLQARYPGKSEPAFSNPPEGLPNLGWILELDGSVALVRASKTTHPFIWFRGGIAHAIPRSDALATHVATANRDLMVGRAYLASGEDIAMVAFDEAIVGEYLSLDYQPSVDDLVTRFEMAIQYTTEWSKTVLERFGGQRFTRDDWHLMSL